MDAIKLWLRQAWIWIVAIGAAAFVLWLRFFHDPQVAKEAELEHRRKETLKRLEAFEKSKKDTKAEETRLSAEVDRIDEELEAVRKARADADAAARDIRNWLKRADED